ncbi:hypothetical protein [Actinomyces qiguomingii]|nr:hypothetical protein [Actinomyces qiguomingii]
MVCKKGDTPFSSKIAGSGSYTMDASLPYSLSWNGMAAGTGVVISGGAYGVNTDDLTDFAATLNSAADWLEDALDLALACLAEVRSLANRPVVFTSLNPDDPLGLRSDTKSGPMFPGDARSRVNAYTFVERINAEAALTTLTSGAGSLDDAVSSLRTLATDVISAGTTYTDAESAANGDWVSVPRLLSWGMSSLGAIPGATELGTVVAAISVLTMNGVVGPDGFEDILQGMQMVVADPMLDDWVNTDLMVLIGLAVWAQQAKTGLESTTVEAYIGQVVAELDPAISRVLPDQVQVGSRRVNTSFLTPMQRVAYYLAVRAEQFGENQYGAPTGVTVTPHGGSSVTVPTGVQDPFGLKTAVPAVAAAGMLPPSSGNAPQPGTAADVIRYCADMKGRDDDVSSGVVSILRTDHADGTTSWLVAVPGTTDWGSGDTNPQDLLTNLQAVSGRPSDMEAAVVTAMRQAGIAPEDKVGLYGHSQGGITAVNVAADPAVNRQFNITNVLTAGSPTAGADLPDNVNALHLENTGDAVPALDAAATPRTRTRTVVTIDTHSSGFDGYPHAPQIYADAVDGIGGNPQIDQWTEELAGITGASEDGAQTTEIVFDITRDSTESPWEQMARKTGKRG